MSLRPLPRMLEGGMMTAGGGGKAEGGGAALELLLLPCLMGVDLEVRWGACTCDSFACN